MLTKRTILVVGALWMGLSLTVRADTRHVSKVPSGKKVVARPSSQLQRHVKGPMFTKRHVPGAPLSVAPSQSKKEGSHSASAPVAVAKGALPRAAHAAANLQGSAINTSRISAAVDGPRLSELSAIRMTDFKAKADQIGQTHLDNQVRGANSATFKGLDKLMPGFRDKAKGASGLRDMAGSGHSRNPVTDGHSLDNFVGDTSSTKGKGRVTHNADGSTTIRNKDGSTTDVWKDGTFYTQNKDGTVEVDHPNGTTDYYGKDGRKTGSTGINRNILDPSNPGYYTNGLKVEDSKGSGSAKGNKGGQQGEPIQDDDTSSGPHHITASDLRGLAARRFAAGTPTGEETSNGGGQVNESKTRQGRIGQTGQPVPDSTVSTSVPDSMQVNQALRIRLRNVTPRPVE